jgi:hypothetical protein
MMSPEEVQETAMNLTAGYLPPPSSSAPTLNLLNNPDQLERLRRNPSCDTVP